MPQAHTLRAGVDEDLLRRRLTADAHGRGHGRARRVGRGVRRNHQQREEIIAAPRDEDGVVSDREGVDLDDTAVDRLCTPRVADRSNKDDRRTDWMVCSGSSFL